MRQAPVPPDTIKRWARMELDAIRGHTVTLGSRLFELELDGVSWEPLWQAYDHPMGRLEHDYAQWAAMRVMMELRLLIPACSTTRHEVHA